MPLSKKRKKKEGRAHRTEAHPAARAPEPTGGSGFLSGMRGGLKDLAGTGGAKKKESLIGKIVTWALFAVALYFVARRFGVLP